MSRIRIAVVTGVLLALLVGSSARAEVTAELAVGDGASTDWEWPFPGRRDIAVVYRAPANEYGAGHRGIDLRASPGTEVRAPADGIVAFSGTVVDRPLVTIEHADGYVSTFEPVRSSLVSGDAVLTGDVIGIVEIGGHAPAGTMHLGARLHGAYINPLLLFGDVPRAVLLPCCAPL